MKTHLVVIALCTLGAPLAWGADEGDQGSEATQSVWLCTEDVCTWLTSETLAEAAVEEAAAEGRNVEIVVVTASQAPTWHEWEFRDSVYDDWDYRDPTDY